MSFILGLFTRLSTAFTGLQVVEAVARQLQQQQSAHYLKGDRVLINGRKLSGPLRPGGSTNLQRGHLNHDDILGKPLTRLRLNSSQGQTTKITYPTLDEYISQTPRAVTPIYSTYCASVIDQLDIHVFPPSSANSPPTSDIPRFEVLESGTGHGSLTLHLSRAIAAANPPPPPIPSLHPSSEEIDQGLSRTQDAAWELWRTQRRAVVHSVEISSKHSKMAQKNVLGFRQGLYWPHIDFYTASIEEWLERQISKRKSDKGFLSIAVLDMPDVHRHLAKVCQAMMPDGKLVLYVPSVTQIGECMRVIRDEDVPLAMERVLELGEGISNGRMWDVRYTVPKNRKPKDSSRGTTDASKPATQEDHNEGEPEAQSQTEPPPVEEVEDSESQLEDRLGDEESATPVMVCRPMVGKMTRGGAFVAVWRKKVSHEDQQQ